VRRRKGDFLFLGGHPALDFVNTRTTERGTPVERLTDFDALVRWSRAVGLPDAVDAEAACARWAGHPDAAALLAEAVALRETTRAWLGGQTDNGLLDTINGLLRADERFARVIVGPDGYVRRPFIGDAGPRSLLAALAGAIADLLCDHRRVVRRCKGRGCDAWFAAFGRTIDRVYCSESRCASRARSARYDRDRGRFY
jgi:predicted RNA-binding Zn ribbon-like protein